MKDLLTGLPIHDKATTSGGEGQRQQGEQASSPGFQIGGKSGGFEAWLDNLTAALEKSSAPTDNPGQSDKTGGSGVYPGGLNADNYFGLLTNNPIFDTTFN